MAHYNIGEWTDYVRDLLAQEQRREMSEHLGTGCEECSSLVGFLRGVAEVAAADALYERASSELAITAGGIFVAPALEQSGIIAALRTLAAKLTFDSASGLNPAGARGHRPAARQLMYQAGDYCVDLRLDRERNTTRVVLVGQVANEKQPLLQLARLPVFVMSGKKIISETASNEFGEFTLEFLPRPNLRLCVQVTQAGVQLEVPLKRSLEEHET
jgi:hypothetical protein